MRGQAPAIVLASLAALGVAIGVLQSPAIPSGPAWAVAMTLLGGIILLVIKEVAKIKRPDGDRIGTRRDDDVKLDREQIKGELTLLSLVNETHELVSDLVAQGSDMKEILRRMTDVLDRSQAQAEINAGALETLIRQLVKNGERMEHLPTLAEMQDGFKENRHDARNAIATIALQMKVGP